MEIVIELGRINDINEIENLYDIVVEDLLKNINYPGWKKGIYPTCNEALVGINKKQLYIASTNKKIIGTIIINHEQEKNYSLANWKIKAQEHEIYVIHTLAVHPNYRGLNIAMQLLGHVEKLAKENNIKTIRLDVKKGNIPAIKLYKRCGYTYVGELNLDYRGSDLGLFELYEKIV